MKVAHIVGARPQFIKCFPVINAIKDFNQDSDTQLIEILIHTGQHYDYAMSRVFFDELGIREPDYHLNVGSGLHGAQIATIIQRVEEALLQESPDLVMLYGDTNSTLGGAIASAKLHIPVAHVEAGLRSFNKFMPEEINRVLTDHVSTILFCSSKTAIRNLIKEGFQDIVNDGKLVLLNNGKETSVMNASKNDPVVINTGDVMYDVLLYASNAAEKKSSILKELGLEHKEYYLFTLHRAENTDNEKGLEKIIDFVNEASSGKTVIFPMHPRTKKVYENQNIRLAENIRIIDPVGYYDILVLLKNSALVLTDSGGIQKEAYWLKVPCITLREETEWVETIDSGWNVLYKKYNGLPKPSNANEEYYGDGKASQRIVDVISEWSGS